MVAGSILLPQHIKTPCVITASVAGLQEQHSQFEAAVLFMDSVVTAVCSTHLGQASSPALNSTLSSTEALLQLLLGARLADPVLLNWHARSLECFSKLLASKPELVPAVMQKVKCPTPNALHQEYSIVCVVDAIMHSASPCFDAGRHLGGNFMGNFGSDVRSPVYRSECFYAGCALLLCFLSP